MVHCGPFKERMKRLVFDADSSTDDSSVIPNWSSFRVQIFLNDIRPVVWGKFGKSASIKRR